MSSTGAPQLVGWERRPAKSVMPTRDAAELAPSALLRRLQRENALLQRRLGKLMLENAILKDVARLCRARQGVDGAGQPRPVSGSKRP